MNLQVLIASKISGIELWSLARFGLWMCLRIRIRSENHSFITWILTKKVTLEMHRSKLHRHKELQKRRTSFLKTYLNRKLIDLPINYSTNRIVNSKDICNIEQLHYYRIFLVTDYGSLLSHIHLIYQKNCILATFSKNTSGVFEGCLENNTRNSFCG